MTGPPGWVVPPPPGDLDERELPLIALDPGTSLRRIHRPTLDPLWFDPGSGAAPRYRFDDPDGRYAVCYLAADVYGAFAETFLRDLPVAFVSRADLQATAVAKLTLTRRLFVVQADGPGLARLGTTAAVAAAKLLAPVGQYAASQAWSRALYAHPAAPDGIRYRSSHDDSVYCYALFDRAREGLALAKASYVLGRQRRLVGRLARRYRLKIL